MKLNLINVEISYHDYVSSVFLSLMILQQLDLESFSTFLTTIFILFWLSHISQNPCHFGLLIKVYYYYYHVMFVEECWSN